MVQFKFFHTLIVVIFHVLIVCPCASSFPQIFTESYKFCTFEFKDKSLEFPDKSWTISSKDFTLHFSPCKSPQSSCSNRYSSCLIQKRNRQVLNLGDEFVAAEDDFILTSSKGAKCLSNPAKNYTLSISLQCSDSIKSQPSLMSSNEQDDCTFEVAMMKPDCRPKCTETVANSHFLDLRSFRRSVRAETESKKFQLTLCGSDRQCGKGVSACELLLNGSVPLANLGSQHFVYDAGKNELTARGRYKQGRIIRDVQVLVRCKWESDLVNARYKPVQIQGRHYHFEVQSSFGCIKLPQNCVVSSLSNLLYNLTGLYKTNGWEVSGVPGGKILLNICGRLNKLQGQCAEQYSQVCHIENNKFLNRGSILLPLQVNDDVIRARFVSGSTCVEDPESLYSTEIEFECSKMETGPIFREIKACRMYISWKTPRACPLDVYRSSNCYMNDRISNRNLGKLYTETDRIYHLTPNNKTRLIYNLCGPIHESCGEFNNVSFCLKTQRKDFVVGWETKELISENGQLRMELHGFLCANGKSTAMVTVHFLCSYEKSPSPPEILVIEDGCKYKVTIFTPLACTWRSAFNNCSLSAANFEYDLSALTLRNENYVVSDGDVDYVFNLCGPVVTRPGVLCRGDTMVCWVNRTEASVKYRYRSLGGVGRPKIRNDSLVVEAATGDYCPQSGHYKTVFNFECSTQGTRPQLVSRTDCVYSFKWKTPEACPQARECIVAGSKPDAQIDLTKLQKKLIPVHIKNGTNRYEFHLCADTYIVSTNRTKRSYTLKREYIPHQKHPYIVLDLQKTCDKDTDFTKLFLKLQCSDTDLFEQDSYENCVLNLTVKSNVFCSTKKEEYFVYSTVGPRPSSTLKETLTAPVSNCTVTNSFTGYEFRLNRMKSEEMRFNNTKFLINLDGEATGCSGIFCKNLTKMVPSICPTPFFNYSHNVIQLKYVGLKRCVDARPYEFDILMRCNQTKKAGTILEDNECKSVITYDLTEACLLLKQEVDLEEHISTGAIVGIVASLVFILICVIITVINRRRCRFYLQYLPFYRDKTAVPIYFRDSTM